MGLNDYVQNAMLAPARQEAEASSHIVEGSPSQHGQKRVWIGWPLNYWRGHLAFTAKQVRLVSALSSTQEQAADKAVVAGHHLNPTIQLI